MVLLNGTHDMIIYSPLLRTSMATHGDLGRSVIRVLLRVCRVLLQGIELYYVHIGFIELYYEYVRVHVGSIDPGSCFDSISVRYDYGVICKVN